MPTVSHSQPASPEFINPTDCHTAHFATRWVHPDTVVIATHGEIDAANAQEFVDYTLRHARHTNHLVVDLGGVDFFGAAGFSALHTVNVRCAEENIEWALMPSAHVTRLLRICDPDSVLPICDSFEEALSSAQGQPRPLLQLVSKSR